LASTGASVIVYAIVGVGLLFLARQTVAKPKEEPPIDVSFHAEEQAPEPVKTEAPPPPPPPTNKPKVKRPGKVAPLQPKAIPDARPDEGNPTGELALGEQEEYGDGEGEIGEPTPPVPLPPPPPAPPPPAPPAPPVEEAEDVTPPVALSGNALPSYPPAARNKGLQGDVVLKVRISVTGEVIDVQLIRGEEPFASVAIAAVRTWRYRPALIAGQPAPFTRRVQIPFRIRG
jgi:periplasmic protein TonB